MWLGTKNIRNLHIFSLSEFILEKNIYIYFFINEPHPVKVNLYFIIKYAIYAIILHKISFYVSTISLFFMHKNSINCLFNQLGWKNDTCISSVIFNWLTVISLLCNHRLSKMPCTENHPPSLFTLYLQFQNVYSLYIYIVI